MLRASRVRESRDCEVESNRAGKDEDAKCVCGTRAKNGNVMFRGFPCANSGESASIGPPLPLAFMV